MTNKLLFAVALLVILLGVAGCMAQIAPTVPNDPIDGQSVGIPAPFVITDIIKADLDYVPDPFGFEIKRSIVANSIKGAKVYFVAVQAHVTTRTGEISQGFVDVMLGSATEFAIMRTPGDESSPDTIIVKVTRNDTNYWVIAIAPQIPLSTGFLYDLKYHEIQLWDIPYRAWLYTSSAKN